MDDQSSQLKEKTAKGLFWGGMSNGVQQLLSLVFGLFLARLLSPDEYGMVGMLAIFTAIASTLCDNGMAVSLINKKTIEYKDLNSVFWFSMGIAVSCYIILFFSAPAIAKFYHQPELVRLARWAFLSIIIASLGITPAAELTKTMRIKEKTIAETSALAISGIIGIILAYAGFSYWSIVIQTLVFVSIKSGVYWYFETWRPSLHWDWTPIKELYHFSFKLMITSLFSIFNSYLFTLILGRLYTEREVGYYNQANKWNTMGSSLVSGMVQSVAQPVLVEVEMDQDRQLRIFRKLVRFTAFISFPAMFGLAFVAPEFITIAITDKWLSSAKLLQILALAGAFVPLMSLFSYLVLSKGDSTSYMWSNILLFVVSLCGVWAIHSLGIMWMIVIFTIIQIGWLMVWFGLVKRKIGYRLIQLAQDIVPFLGCTLGVIILVWYVTLQIQNVYVLFLTKVLLVAGSYCLIMRIFRANIYQESIHYFLRILHRGEKK